jgi:hypothetical protein
MRRLFILAALAAIISAAMLLLSACAAGVVGPTPTPKPTIETFATVSWDKNGITIDNKDGMSWKNVLVELNPDSGDVYSESYDEIAPGLGVLTKPEFFFNKTDKRFDPTILVTAVRITADTSHGRAVWNGKILDYR